jgi:hypothetical protein
MTTDRIATVETELELVKELLVTTARHAERAHDDNDTLRMELRESSRRTEAVIEKLSQDMNATHQRMDSFIDGIQRLVTQQQERVNQHDARIERLEDIAQSVLNVQVQTARRIELLEQQIELQRQANDEHRRTTDAALERIDRVLDYLMRRDGE